MPTIERCLECLDFPCTCGKQYRNMEDYQMETLILNLQDLLRKRGHTVTNCLVDNIDIREHVRGEAEKPYPLFDREFYEELNSWFPTPWAIMIKSESGFKVLWMKLADIDSDSIPLPGLFMLCLYLRYIDVIDIFKTGSRYLALFEDMLKALLKDTPIGTYLDKIYHVKLEEKISIFRNSGFVDVFKKIGEHEGKLAECIYHIYVQLYDMRDRYRDLLDSTMIFIERYADLNNISDHSPRTIVNKFNEELFYIDDDIRKIMKQQKDNFLIDKLIP